MRKHLLAQHAPTRPITLTMIITDPKMNRTTVRPERMFKSIIPFVFSLILLITKPLSHFNIAAIANLNYKRDDDQKIDILMIFLIV